MIRSIYLWFKYQYQLIQTLKEIDAAVQFVRMRQESIHKKSQTYPKYKTLSEIAQENQKFEQEHKELFAEDMNLKPFVDLSVLTKQQKEYREQIEKNYNQLLNKTKKSH